MKVITDVKKFWKISPPKRKLYCLSEEATTSYPITDNLEVIVEVEKYFSENNASILYNPPSDIKKIGQVLKLRKTAAKLLLRAAQKLPKGYKFLISEGYRPLWYQKKVFDQIYTDMKNKHPDLTDKQVWEKTTLYVADPSLCPPHSTGGTFDLTIVDENNNPIDMGNPMNTVDEKSNTFTNGLTKKQKDNRNLLFEILNKVGFVNIGSEWWHYSYGDQYWAIYHEKSHAIYGSVKEERNV